MKFPQNFRKFYRKFPWNFPRIFGNFPQNLPEIFTTFCNSYEFYSQNFYILSKNVINNYYMYKIYPTISTVWCISRKCIVRSYRILNLRIHNPLVISVSMLHICLCSSTYSLNLHDVIFHNLLIHSGCFLFSQLISYRRTPHCVV